LPHEAAYHIKATAIGQPDGYRALSEEDIKKAADIRDDLNNAAAGKPPSAQMREWITRNKIDPKVLAGQLTPAHVVAMQAYTGSNHSLLNAVAPSPGFSDLKANLLLDQKVRTFADLLVDQQYKTVSHKEIPHAIAGDPQIRALQETLRQTVRRNPPDLDAKIDLVRQKVHERVAQIAPGLRPEMRAHLDMTVDTLQHLPPADNVTVYRADWSAGRLGDPVTSSLSMYGKDTITFGGLTSSSLERGVAKEFLRKQKATATRHPVLIEMQLTGHSGRDITALSKLPNEKEVLFLPGAQFTVVSREVNTVLGYEHIVVREIPPVNVAAATPALNAGRSATEIAGLNRSIPEDAAEALTALTPQVAALAEKSAQITTDSTDLNTQLTELAALPTTTLAQVAKQAAADVEKIAVDALTNLTIAENAAKAVAAFSTDPASDPAVAETKKLAEEANQLWNLLGKASENAEEAEDQAEKADNYITQAVKNAENELLNAFWAQHQMDQHSTEAQDSLTAAATTNIHQAATAAGQATDLVKKMAAGTDPGPQVASAILAIHENAATHAAHNLKAAEDNTKTTLEYAHLAHEQATNFIKAATNNINLAGQWANHLHGVTQDAKTHHNAAIKLAQQIQHLTNQAERAHTNRQVPAGRVLAPAADAANLEAAKSFPASKDRYVIFAHGTSGHLVVGEQHLTPRQLAEMIRKDPAWGNRPVVLMSCDTGADAATGFAAQLARELPGTSVTAPNSTAWTTPSGQAFVAATGYDAEGRPKPLAPTDADQWLAFTADPKSAEVKVARLGARLTPAKPGAAGEVATPWPGTQVVLRDRTSKVIGVAFPKIDPAHAVLDSMPKARENESARAGSSEPAVVLRVPLQDQRGRTVGAGFPLDATNQRQVFETPRGRAGTGAVGQPADGTRAAGPRNASTRVGAP